MNKILYNILFWLTYVGFNIENILSIGENKKLFKRFYIYGIPGRDIVLLIMLVFFVLNLKGISSLIKKDKIFLFIFIVYLFSFQGLLLNGLSSVPMIRADLRSLLWFLGGISFCFVLIKTGKVKFNLQILVVLTTFLLILATYYGEMVNFRITNPNMFMFMGFLIVPLILLFNIEHNALKCQWLPILSLGVLLYCGAYLTKCRSVAIVSLIILVLYCVSLGLGKRCNFIYKTPKIERLSFAVMLGIGICLFVSLALKPPDLHHLSKIGLSSIMSDVRYAEIKGFFDQTSNSMLIIFGKGLGGIIASPIYPLNGAVTMHVGIFNFWMKMGIIPFIIVVFFLFIRTPYLYMRTLRKPMIFSPFKRTANLVVLPALFPWIVSLAMSGGFSEVNFLFAGFAYLMYGEICKHGLPYVLTQEKTRGRNICLIKEETRKHVYAWRLTQ